MVTVSNQKRLWQRAVPPVIVLLLTISALVIGSAFATAQNAHDHSDVDHHHGFTGSGTAQEWPPRPTSASGGTTKIDGTPAADEAPPFVGGAAALAGQAIARSAAAVPLDQALSEALGEEWTHISSSPASSGKGSNLPPEKTYYSRTFNHTVIATFGGGGVEVYTFEPDQVQPIIAPAETAEASELGRAWLLEQGFSGVEFYEGAGIRALNNGEFYPTRMVYITYAIDDYEDPEYSALVDLTNGIVVEGGAL